MSSQILNVSSSNATIENNFCYADYLHEKPLVNKSADGKYQLKSEITKYTLKTDLHVPKSNLYKTHIHFRIHFSFNAFFSKLNSWPDAGWLGW